jgi:hypothetical protein
VTGSSMHWQPGSRASVVFLYLCFAAAIARAQTDAWVLHDAILSLLSAMQPSNW